MDAEAAGLLIGLGGIGMCIEEQRLVGSSFFILDSLKRCRFGHSVNAVGVFKIEVHLLAGD